MVARAEQLADTLPDSTVRLIDSVLRMPVYFSERERIDMALLQAEALFGCRDGVHAVSPVMDDDFFDEHATLSTSPDLERAADRGLRAVHVRVVAADRAHVKAPPTMDVDRRLIWTIQITFPILCKRMNG